MISGIQKRFRFAADSSNVEAKSTINSNTFPDTSFTSAFLRDLQKRTQYLDAN